MCNSEMAAQMARLTVNSSSTLAISLRTGAALPCLHDTTPPLFERIEGMAHRYIMPHYATFARSLHLTRLALHWLARVAWPCKESTQEQQSWAVWGGEAGREARRRLGWRRVLAAPDQSWPGWNRPDISSG